MAYEVRVRASARKSIEKAPQDVQNTFDSLVDLLRESGPTGPFRRRNYGKLRGSKTRYHRHLSVRMTPGLRLKTLREAHGLTQEELGGKIGKVSDKRISDWESGRRAVPKRAAKALSAWFSVPAERFL